MEGSEGQGRCPQGGRGDIPAVNELLSSDHQAGLSQWQLSLLETQAKQQRCKRVVGSCLLHEHNRLRATDAAVNRDAR